MTAQRKQPTKATTPPASRGYLMLLAIVMGAVFLSVLGALSGFVLSEEHLQVKKQSQAEAFTIAEAGLEYYRWFLAHFPGDVQNGTGHAGPYSIPYTDPEGGQTGTIALSVAGNTACGLTTSIDIVSKGTPTDDPNVSHTVYARYAQPSVATYSYILNDNVWAGADRVILGPYHANGGIRMDGSSNSPVTSSVSSWTCTSSFGCSFWGQTKPGVWGGGTNQNLWSYPTPQVDFGAIAANFTSLKATAQSTGRYFNDGNPSGAQNGYHLIFNADSTVTVKKVTSVTVLQSIPIDGSSGNEVNDYTLIKNETLVGTYPISSSCGLIFVEDNAWIEGVITKKVTVVVADVTSAQGTADVVLPGNITYSAYDGTAGLTVIGQHDVLVGPNTPTNTTLNGIFIAQSGAFGRNMYTCQYPSYSTRGTLTILGTTVSNNRTGTQWTYSGFDGCGNNQISGYTTRIDSYDRRLATDPPPFTPFVATEYQLMDWREK